MSVFDFWAFKPNMWAGFHHGSLNDPHQATMNLANLLKHNTNTAGIHQQIYSWERNDIWTEQKLSQRESNWSWCVFMSLPALQKWTHHSVAAVTGQDDDINGGGMVGHTDSPIFGFVFTEKWGQGVNIWITKTLPDCFATIMKGKWLEFFRICQKRYMTS